MKLKVFQFALFNERLESSSNIERKQVRTFPNKKYPSDLNNITNGFRIQVNCKNEQILQWNQE